MRQLSRAAAAVIVGLVVQSMLVSSASAIVQVNVGDLLKFSNGLGGNGGGEFGALVNGGPGSFVTFCVERGESLNFTDSFVVSAISTTSQNSGVALHAGTADLFSRFHNGNLLGYTGTAGQQTSLQLAIWFFQGQLAIGPSLVATYAADAGAQAYVLSAAGAVGTGAVKILNMRTLAAAGQQDSPAQDVLIVPEPASVLAWSLIGGCFVVGNRLRRGKWLLG